MNVPHFRVPLNLPHAATVAVRLLRFVEVAGITGAALERARAIATRLAAYRFAEENPPEPEAVEVVAETASLGRELVDAIEATGLGHDRLGQAVRNLFECLGLAEEGAAISLRAGEDPRSMMRPS